MDFIFSIREFWLEMNIPKSIVMKKFVDYFGDKNSDIENRNEAIEFLSKIITDIQNKMVTQINEVNANDIIKNWPCLNKIDSNNP